MKIDKTNINGYIEGFYGRLLKWTERHAILKKLNECKFNSYFYCPKEDLKHRLSWRQDYTYKWISSFNNFCKVAKKFQLNVLIGISPGLDFNFEENNTDLHILVNKAKKLKLNGATYIVLMFDDIPERNQIQTGGIKPEGVLHAELANRLSKELNETIFVVPRVYCDELINKKCRYLKDFGNTLNEEIPLFYCGKKIISDTNSEIELSILKKFVSNRVLFWDNLYANDYCPKKIFVGPYFGRLHFNNTMINPTGLIETDLLILDLINFSTNKNQNQNGWDCTLKKYKIPDHFRVICRYFFPLNDIKKTKSKLYNYDQEIEALDFLLWKWKNPLSREWYQYLLILKQDLQLLNSNLTISRIKKVFPIPLKEVLLKLKLEEK